MVVTLETSLVLSTGKPSTKTSGCEELIVVVAAKGIVAGVEFVAVVKTGELELELEDDGCEEPVATFGVVTISSSSFKFAGVFVVVAVGVVSGSGNKGTISGASISGSTKAPSLPLSFVVSSLF